MNKAFWVLLVMLMAFSCKPKGPHRPSEPFSELSPPPAPDYAQSSAWAALPTMQDEADGVPAKTDLQDQQAEVPADVFFIHPTIFFSDEAWNASLSDEKLQQEVDETTIRHQASIFNAAGRVYAPRYREATFGVFTLKDRKTQAKALALAYQDVRAAFDYYLEHYNEGRPFFIATHSQGTVHGIRLIRERIDDTPLQERLIAAYLVGWTVPADTFQSIPPCENADQTQCFTSWCTFTEGYYPPFAENFKGAVCTNPITWRLDSLPSSYEEHKGSVLKNYKKIYPEVFCAQALPDQGLLWVTKPKIFGGAVLNQKNWHVADYNLFWLDIRENAAHRLERFLERD